MAFTVDEEWYNAYLKRTGQPPAQSDESKQTKRKYGNTRVTVDNETFDSKHELQVFETLKLRAKAEELTAIARQVAFYLPGNIKYIADFVVFYPDGHYDVIDAKSEATKRDKVYRLKKRLMKECRGLEITEL